ncbi:MAG TPA: 2-C-methyl-D-erythritol 2,4-cyclodiphosphate synthase [Rhodospirillaceae bacterium]|jgi:2-C-methyl-D-erythritol 4-phosphate cytidylyltransferase/2-C-methyl-D-erythritol 2,4-cyclodiphosphate synthase|nr:2-C-methyl-D-erythritol 2,4-cyclodiphosphate synthase [Alphaproteobacteria bacterium]HBH26917.1 2-C-methyl-D-erythritol 2,4-cyclodiphosphate synthase [Rhodospirillaceae bacterium]
MACPPFACVVVAAGTGARAGGAAPKQYQALGGRPLLRHTLEALLACPALAELRVVIQPHHLDLYTEATRGLSLPPPVWGGKETRQESARNGVCAFARLEEDDILLIHDAARPFVSVRDIEAVATAARAHGAATLTAPMADSLRGPGGPLDRAGVVAVTTPQGFRYGPLARAHAAAGTGFTDDAALVETTLGLAPALVPGGRWNMKITTQEDMMLAQKCLAQPRTALGTDVHAFGPAGSGPLVLGDVEIPHDRGLVGHSDADAALHAVVDALLGLACAGDIGVHFPPTDPQWRGVASRVFVEKAVGILGTAGGRLTHLDLTIVCEAPRIGPHRQAIRAALAEMVDLDAGLVSVKATTTEGLGFTGRGEGLAAQAVATALF